MHKTLQGNVGNLFYKCMRQVSKDHPHELLDVPDYLFPQTEGPVSFVECLQWSPTGTTGILGWFVTLCRRLRNIEKTF